MFEDLIYVLGKYHGWLFDGLLLTLQLLVIAVIFGSLLAVPLAIARTSKKLWVQAVPFGFIYLFWYAAYRTAIYDVLRRGPADCQY